MKRTRIKMLSVLMLGGCLLGSGCSFNTLIRNIWTGFGNGIGFIPSQLVVDTLLGTLGLDDDSTT